MIKLLAVDMDGTCLNSKGKMTDKTLEALKKAAESGVIVVPTTGRNITCLPKRIQGESFYRYVISSNGALVVDLKEDKEIFKSYIDPETAVEILDKCRKHLLLVAAHIDRDYYVQGPLLYIGVKKFLKEDATVLKYVRNLAAAIKKNNYLVEEFQFFYHNGKYNNIIKEIIKPYPGICSAHSEQYAEIFSSKGSKGTALLALGEHLGIRPDEIACAGDEENDLSMFSVAGHRFAMGNAIDAVKEKATVIIPSNDEDGVAEAINRYILSDESGCKND